MRGKTTWTILLAVLVVVAAIAIVAGLATPTVASSVQAKIDAKLADLGVNDAQDEGIVLHSTDSSIAYRMYTSEATGMEYYFDSVSGELIKTFRMISPEMEQDEQIANVQAGKMETNAQIEELDIPDEAERVEIAMEYALDCVGDSLIGELQASASSNLVSVYVHEYYDGMDTGTEVDVFFSETGDILGSYVEIGTLFQRNADGTYSLSLGDDYIPIEEAIGIAFEEMQGFSMYVSADAEDATVALENNADSIYYLVKCPFLDSCVPAHTLTAYIRVDAYTGEILMSDHTK